MSLNALTNIAQIVKSFRGETNQKTREGRKDDTLYEVVLFDLKDFMKILTLRGSPKELLSSSKKR